MNEQLELFKCLPMSRKKKSTDYGEFTDKFKTKLTTDDCYTPSEVMEVVNNYVREKFNTGDRPFVRPFYPGGCFETFEYPENCVVVDNPPFSIYAKIVRWYLANKIDFFLFGPALTIMVRNASVCYVVTNACVTYENGAVVNTSFCTSLSKDLILYTDYYLKSEIESVNATAKGHARKIEYPEQIVTAARLGKLLKNENGFIEIKKCDAEYIGTLDCGQRLFGGGLIISEKAAAEKAAAEKATAEKAAAEKATIYPLSDREMNIVRRLSKCSTKQN